MSELQKKDRRNGPLRPLRDGRIVRLGALAVSANEIEAALRTGCIHLDHHPSRTTLWKVAGQGDQILLIDRKNSGTIYACTVVSKSIKIAADVSRPDTCPWHLTVDLKRWCSDVDSREMQDLIHKRYPFREYHHLPPQLFERVWQRCQTEIRGPSPDPDRPRLRGRRKLYAISAAITTEEHEFIEKIGALHPSGRSRRDQKFAFVARKGGELCGAIQVGLPRTNAPRHYLASQRFGSEFDSLRTRAVSIVRLLTPESGVSTFAVHRALLEELCAVAPNMVSSPLTYIDGASYQYHPLATEFGFQVEIPSRIGGSFYFWKPFNLPSYFSVHSTPSKVRDSIRSYLERQQESGMRVWIAKIGDPKLLQVALEHQTWAIRDSHVNLARWKQVKHGDLLLLATAKHVTHVARVRGTTNQVLQGYEQFPLHIRFTLVETYNPPHRLESHIGSDILREVRSLRGGIVEVHGINPSDFGLNEKAESGRLDRVPPQTKKHRSALRHTGAVAASASSQSDDEPGYAKILYRPPPAEQQPAEQRPAEQQPAEQQPAEQQPAELRPAELRPAEPRPAEQRIQPETEQQQPSRPGEVSIQPVDPGFGRGGSRPVDRATPRRSRNLLREGAQIDGYRLIKRLGRGHSAEVWQATVLAPPLGTDLEGGDEVAIKFYSNAVLALPHQSLRIQREFLVAYELDHHNIVRVHDLVLSPNRPAFSFLVMDYVPGRTLREQVEANGPLPPHTVALMGKQIFDALTELHSKDALHRDIKAANIIDRSTGADPDVVLLDLGIVAVETDKHITTTSTFLGSKHYAPLEQLVGEVLTPQSDIYGVGATLFHLYEGDAMYHAAGPVGGIVTQMLNNPAMLKARDGASEAEGRLVGFINRCIDHDRKQRPTSAREAASELADVARALQPTR